MPVGGEEVLGSESWSLRLFAVDVPLCGHDSRNILHIDATQGEEFLGLTPGQIFPAILCGKSTY